MNNGSANPAGTADGITRRDWFRNSAFGLLALFLGGITVWGANRSRRRGLVWQLDPHKCVQCGRCATECVLSPSAVKCVHAYDVCGYCNRCGGYHQSDAKTTDTAAEHRLCPTNAIRRTFVEDPFYEYTIAEDLCYGCGKCVKGCNAFGNGSLYLQVRHDRCVNCNDCRIARNCPAGAYRRVPAEHPYILKGKQGAASGGKVA